MCRIACGLAGARYNKGSMKVRVDIDTKTFVRFWLVVIGFGLAMFAIYSARVALIIIGTALFLALALNTPVSRLARVLPGRSRVLGTAISYLVVVLFLAGFIFMVVPPIIDQTVKFVNTLPSLVERATTQWQGLNLLVEKYNLQGELNQTVETIKNSVSGWAGNIGTNVVNGLGPVAGFFSAAILVIVLTFLMLVEGPTWLKRLWSVYTNEETMKYHHNLLHRMYQVVNGYVTGQLTVSALDGFFAGLFVFLLSLFLNVPTNLAFPTAAIMFILSMIPMFGALIGGVLVTLLMLFNDPAAAVFFAIYFLIYQQIENNFISPTIQAKRLELSPLAILASVTVGLYVFGIVGGIISIPIAGCIRVLVEDYLERAKHQRKKSKKPLDKLVSKLQKEA